ncbi:MAG: phosphate ABC transporter permease PstA [Halobacteriovoraceae bacterium]|nr:phosphate ABC transporter permease PstA [Halobacteriovoraceae bacterium]
MKLKNRKIVEKTFKHCCLCISWITVLLLGLLLLHVLKEGWQYLDTHFLSNFQSRFPHKAGIKAGIWGTCWLILLTALISVPIGIGSAIFLEEYGVKGRWGKIIEINVANLAGVPSIVYGLLGLAIFVRFFSLGRSLLSGALTLSLLIMPIIIVSAREAIRSVPNAIRMAAFALGVEKRHVIWGQVLPMALPGIMTGVILSLSRAIGETAPLIIVGALTYVAFIPQSPTDEFTVLPLQIYNWASRPQEEFHSLSASGIIVLLAVMITMNFIAVIIRQRSSKRINL